MQLNSKFCVLKNLNRDVKLEKNSLHTRMSSAAVMPALLPDSQGVPMSARPPSKCTSGNAKLRSSRNGPPSLGKYICLFH